jgi:hypothetical protein
MSANSSPSVSWLPATRCEKMVMCRHQPNAKQKTIASKSFSRIVAPRVVRRWERAIWYTSLGIQQISWNFNFFRNFLWCRKRSSNVHFYMSCFEVVIQGNEWFEILRHNDYYWGSVNLINLLQSNSNPAQQDISARDRK